MDSVDFESGSGKSNMIPLKPKSREYSSTYDRLGNQVGEGPKTSRTGGKQTLNRGFITQRHEGRLARPSEYQAAKLDRNITVSEVPDAEWESIKDMYPREVERMLQQGASRLGIKEYIDSLN